MHLHLWNAGDGGKGFGSHFVKLTLPYFFGNLRLKDLYCEPYALNRAPNNTMEKLGFELVKSETKIPGSFNFKQEVKLWHLTKAAFNQL